MTLGIDVVIVSHRPGRETARVIEDAHALAGCDVSVNHIDNTGNPLNLSQAWNDGAAQGQHEFVAFLNNDTIPCPEWGTRMIRVLERHDSVGAIVPYPVLGPKTLFLGREFVVTEPPSREIMAALAERASEEYRDDAPVKKYGAGHPGFFAVMFRRELFETLKGFDERFRFYGQDREICDRLRLFGKVPALATACPFYGGRSIATQRAIGAKDINIKEEYAFCSLMTRLMHNGEIPRWHTMSEEERRAVREDPRYAISKGKAR